MLTPEQIYHRLQPMSAAKVAAASGVTYDIVKRLKRGEVKNPRYDAVKKLSDYLLKLESI